MLSEFAYINLMQGAMVPERNNWDRGADAPNFRPYSVSFFYFRQGGIHVTCTPEI